MSSLHSHGSLASIVIIGGGWYGCHIALTLRSLGFKVRLFEQNDRLLGAASGNNQCRLHMGYHYARHSETRAQSHSGFKRFIEEYPHLSRPIPHNIYAVASRESLIDYDTYRIIMSSSEMTYSSYSEGTPCEVVELTNTAGAICTMERVILQDRARQYFESMLDEVSELGKRITEVRETGDGVVVNGDKCDYVIDATWGHYSRPSVEVIYEPTLLLYFQGPIDFPAVTLVDGPLCSLYPTEVPGLYTLSSVPYTPLAQCRTSAEAYAVRDTVDAETIAKKRTLMMDQITHYLPRFRELFRYVGPQLAIKTKVVGAHDDRSCHVSRNGRVLSVMSGKIDTIFFATERILSLLTSNHTKSSDDDMELPQL